MNRQNTTRNHNSTIKELSSFTHLPEEEISSLYEKLETEGFGECKRNPDGTIYFFQWKSDEEKPGNHIH